MRKIYKYPLITLGRNTLVMPKGAKVVHVEAQENGARGLGLEPCLWALVDPMKPGETVTFNVVGTGHAIPDDCQYVGTCQIPPFVWHVFKEVA